MDPPLNPPAGAPLASETVPVENITINESVNSTIDQTAVGEETIHEQRKRRAWAIKSTEEGKEIAKNDQGFENFADYFSESDADESLVKTPIVSSSTSTSVIQTLPPPAPAEEQNTPILEQVNVENPPVILNPGNLEESVPGPVQDSVTGGPGEHPATPPSDAITTAAPQEEENQLSAEILEPVLEPAPATPAAVEQEESSAGVVTSQEETTEKVEEEAPAEDNQELLHSIQPSEQLPAELLAEDQPGAGLTTVASLVEQLEAEKQEESVKEDEAPLTRPGLSVEETEMESQEKASPRKPPKKEEAAKAVAVAAKEVAEAAKAQKEVEKTKRKITPSPKKSAADLSAEWDDGEDSNSVPEATEVEKTADPASGRRRGRPAKLQDKVEETPKPSPKSAKNTKLNMEKADTVAKKNSKKAAKNTEEVEESLENIEKELAKPAEEVEKNKSKKEEPKQSSSKKGGKKKEDWVTLIFGENGEKGGETKKGTPRKKSEKGKAEDSVYDLEPEAEEFLMKGTPFFSKGKETEKKPRKTRKQDLAKKTNAVTKIGNNMYFYTGPGGSGSPPPLVDHDDEDGNWSDGPESEPKKKGGKSPVTPDVEGSRKSSRAGKGRNPRLERDDEEVDLPRKPELSKPEPFLASSKKNETVGRSRTKRCNECDGCTREDCGKCEMCQDRPKYGGLNKKKQACLMRQCLMMRQMTKTIFDAGSDEENFLDLLSPAVKRRGSKTGSTVTATATSTPAVRTNSRDNSTPVRADSRRGSSEVGTVTPPRDEDLPEFDPENFTPGYVPKTVKKGDDEYVIVVSGVADTGLCGKYWGDLDNLPPRRRSNVPEKTPTAKKAPVPATPVQKTKSVAIAKASLTPAKATPTAAKATPKSVAKKDAKKEDTPPPKVATPEPAARGKKRKTEESPVHTPEPATDNKKAKKRKTEIEAEQDVTEPASKGKKRKTETEAEPVEPVAETEFTAPAKKSRASPVKNEGVKPETEKDPEMDKDESITTTYSDYDQPSEPLRTTKRPSTARKDEGTPDKQSSPLTTKGAAAISAALQTGTPAGQQRSVSCVADTSTQREVVVECFAPYDDHRWVNIGKERDGMAPDAVQYARALRPPYHLLSFLRIKGHSTKGMSCTDKNTMVFVVLEGEITVILHTTQFNAKKGDSFYIPPKNYYNLINQKAREAELSLIQFQYDGPLPTVQPSQN